LVVVHDEIFDAWVIKKLMETPKYKKSPTKTVFYLKLTSHHAFQNTVYAKERGLRKRT